MKKISSNEVLFWHIAKSETEGQISHRLNIRVEEVVARIKEARNNYRLVKKFEKWGNIVSGGKINHFPQGSNFRKTNDWSFHEQLEYAGITWERIKILNKNFNKIGGWCAQ